MSNAPSPEVLWPAVESIYRHEIRMLQRGDYLDWLSFFAPEFRYRMPVVRSTDARADMVAAQGELGYYDENRDTMELRVGKLASSNAWSEVPPSRLRYFVQILDLTVDNSEVVAVSNVLAFRARNESQENRYYGERTDRFIEVNGQLKIADRTVVLDQVRLAAENLNVFL
ncbi:aromatic-ring-hydroxylating dioxygenase subunit beta [Streptomyces sp. GbtcB6]|uniref:aromatic-ring-hydroxylating dioxygenase subunit beta n=1 Tax=Streptomyces sp. GbtcB6 TaxID=2824751 RepID=UPI001C311BC0|nr:aromatic-ring-hydroxylating dioxygenase subunit beta [Streptomyces sp. GbtcB6]